MEIRAVEPADAPALEPLFTQWGHPLGPEELAVQIRSWRDAPAAEFYVAVVQGELAGMAAVAATPHLGRPGRTARLMGLAVRDGYRRRGIGRFLLDEATRRATVWGCDQLELTSSRSRDAAHDFYLALGYRDSCRDHARYVLALPADGGRDTP